MSPRAHNLYALRQRISAGAPREEILADLDALITLDGPPDFDELLAVALDLAQDKGELSDGLARSVALVAGPWSDGSIGWLRSATHGHAASVLPASGGSWIWAAFDTDNHSIGTGSAPTIAAAMRATDEALRAEGRLLLGGLPPEVEIGRTFIGVDYGNGPDAPAFVVVERGRIRVVNGPVTPPDDAGGIHPDPRDPVWRPR